MHDVADQCNRPGPDSYTQVTDTRLPFDDASFDVVLSNHVIEHVGDRLAQREHLRELRRVLKPEGVGYLAVPNRWMIVEPHYRLAFLSWLPHAWRTPYLRAFGKGEFYDCEPLQPRQLERIFREVDLDYRNLCIDALRETLEIEHADSWVTACMRRIPTAVLRPLQGLIPTLVYRFSK